MAKVIYNNIIPFKGYTAITILPFIFARKSAKYLKDYVVNHECIHLRQQLEVLVASAIIIAVLILVFNLSWWWLLLSLVVYYACYGIDYAVRYVAYGSPKEAYRNIAAEQEAYANQYDLVYLKARKPFAWCYYLLKKTYNRH